MNKKLYSGKAAVIAATVFALSGAFRLSAQVVPQYDWANVVGKTGAAESGRIMAASTDRNGNVYTTGYVRDTVDFDPGSGTMVVETDEQIMFISKTNKHGQVKWVKTIRGTAGVYANAIAVGRADTMMVVGGFYGTADFDPGTGVANRSSLGSQDYFILRIDTNGNFIGCSTGADVAFDGGAAVSADANGNFYATFTLGSSVASDLAVVKYNPDGTTAWVAQISGHGYCGSGNNVAVDAAGNVFVTGYYSGRKDFDPGSGNFDITSTGGTAGSSAPTEAFVLKLTSAGALSWVKTISSTGNENGLSIAVDPAGNVYSTGHFNGSTTDFDPGTGTTTLSASGGYKGYIWKLDNSGNFVWVKAINSPNEVTPHSLHADNSGSLYLAGEYSNSYTLPWDGGSIHTAPFSTTTNSFLLKFDTSGTLLWKGALDVTSSSGNSARGRTVLDADGSWYVPYTFTGTADLDPGTGTHSVTSVGNQDMGLLKLRQCMLNDGVTLAGTTITATMTGATYQWIDCAGNTPVSGATSQSFTPAVTGNYAVIVSSGSCVDTSVCTPVLISVGVSDVSAGANVSVFPNPVENGSFSLMVNAAAAGMYEANLTDMLGRQVWTHSAEANRPATINAATVAPGVYMLQVWHNGRQYNTRVHFK